MNRVTLIKGISQPEISHERACRALLTHDAADRVHHTIPPSLGSLASLIGKPAPYLVFGDSRFGHGYGGAGVLGARFEPKVIPPKAVVLTNDKRESAKAIERYGKSEFGASCLAARRAIESGAVFVTVVSGGWDTHANAIESARRSLAPHLDQGMSALIEDLHQRGLLDSTLLVAMGEFGRTAELNPLGGRDHDPESGFALVAGAGVPQGQVIADRPAKGADVTMSQITAKDIPSLILCKLGIEVEGCLPISGRC